MNNQLSVYDFQQNQIRTQLINNNPYFCLSDCCKALGFKNSHDRDFKAGVEKIYLSYPSGKKLATFINEPNLYRLIFRSNKPQAQAFADWVYNEVLPSIRKTGGYGALDVKSLAHAVAAELKTLPASAPALPAPKPKQPTYPDYFYKFVEQQIIRSDEVTPFADIYQIFDLFCFAEGKPTPSANKLGRFLMFMGFDKQPTRKGEKGYTLSLKQYNNSQYRYRYRPCDYYDGAGVYRCANGESYRVIRKVDDKNPTLIYSWFNPRTNQAEGGWMNSDQMAFESAITGKLVEVSTVVGE